MSAWIRVQVPDYGDLSYLLKDQYEASMRALIGRAQLLPVSDVAKDAFVARAAEVQTLNHKP